MELSACFEAVLKNEAGESLALGHATAVPETKSVNFESDFVPLYPIGTPLEIARLSEGQEIHRFKGSVYLSDKSYMRIVSVEDELLPGCEAVYCDGLPFHGTFSYIKTKSNVLERLFKKSTEQLIAFSAPVSELNLDHLVFQYNIEHPFDIGQTFVLQTDKPLPPLETVIEIDRQFLFGAVASYRCKLQHLRSEDEAVLQSFLQDYALRHRKLF